MLLPWYLILWCPGRRPKTGSVTVYHLEQENHKRVRVMPGKEHCEDEQYLTEGQPRPILAR